MTISFASGKGGAGKTFLSAHSLDFFLKKGTKVALADLDVEEPNSKIFFDIEDLSKKEAFAYVPEFIKENCTECNRCLGLCKFNAFTKLPGSAIIFKQMCHDCGLCYYACKNGAIVRTKMRIGEVKSYNYNGAKIFEGLLDIGMEQGVVLIKQVKKEALAEELELLIQDSAPGTSCSFVETISESDITFMSIEDSPMGIHDGEIAIKVLEEMKKDFYIIINKDIESNYSQGFRKKFNEKIIATIPEKKEIASRYAEKKLSPEDADIKKAMNEIFSIVEKKRGEKK
ncbi:MAG: hypothetical protein JXR63_00795 [Spirochaetales bacterium]|nr:hypothetical protein [Spirochaetales bacterium]